jgi:NitT/TauT family transport system substrate-binding protein
VQISGNTIDTEDNPFVSVIVGPDSGIESFADLGGTRVSSPTLSGVIHIATLFSAKEAGVDPSTIEGVQVPPPNTVDQFNSGEIDAAEALEPFASALEGMGNVSIGDPFAAIGLPLATNFWIAQGEWATANPDAVEGFTAAMEQAIEFIASDEEAARSVLMEYTGLPMPVAANVVLPTFDTEIRTDDLGIWIEVLQSLDQFDGDVQPADLVLAN